jgi:hypothetical protein
VGPAADAEAVIQFRLASAATVSLFIAARQPYCFLPRPWRTASASRGLIAQRITHETNRRVAAATARISRLEGMEAHACTGDVRFDSDCPGECFDTGTPVSG